MAPIVPILPFIAMAASVGGTVYSAISQANAGKEEKQATEINAARIDTQIGQTAEEARLKVEQEQDKQRRLLSSAKARVGASGVTMEGSPLLAMMESQAQGEKDVANIKQNYQWQTDNLNLEKQDILYAGTQRQKAANIGAGTSLLTGLSSVAENAYKYWG